MRPVRPTLQVLIDMIDCNLFHSDDPRHLIEQNDRADAATPFEGLDFTTFNVTLLNMARQAFSGSKITATKHSEFSTIAKRPAYEIRNRQTGWRGIVMLDQYGDPWMVYCGSHDDFHSNNCKSFIRQSNADNYMPNEDDYLVRRREEERRQFLDFERRVAQEMLDAVRTGIDVTNESQQSAKEHVLTSASQLAEAPITAKIQVQQDEEPDSGDISQFIELTLDYPYEENNHSSTFLRLHDTLIICFNAVCQPHEPDQPAETSIKIYSDGTRKRATMSAFVLLEQEDIERINNPHFLEDAESLYDILSDTEPEPMLHRVPKGSLPDAYIEGDLIRSLCGKWFVPTRDESSELPECPACNDILTVKNLMQIAHEAQV
jgi:hypothetical protein